MKHYDYNKEWNDKHRDIIEERQRIVCAANRHKITGRIICGARHWDAVMRSQLQKGEDHFDFDQGFLTNYQEFKTREEAWVIAEKNNQIIKLCYEGQKDYLYSENCW